MWAIDGLRRPNSVKRLRLPNLRTFQTGTFLRLDCGDDFITPYLKLRLATTLLEFAFVLFEFLFFFYFCLFFNFRVFLIFCFFSFFLTYFFVFFFTFFAVFFLNFILIFFFFFQFFLHFFPKKNKGTFFFNFY